MRNSKAKGKLCKENQRNADHKPFVQGFMPDNLHGQVHARTTAQYAEQEKGFFRYAPCTVYGSQLVPYGNDNGNEVDSNQPVGQQMHKMCLL